MDVDKLLQIEDRTRKKGQGEGNLERTELRVQIDRENVYLEIAALSYRQEEETKSMMNIS